MEDETWRHKEPRGGRTHMKYAKGNKANPSPNLQTERGWGGRVIELALKRAVPLGE